VRVLVIGASRGIGFEFARQYRADGARVTAAARNETRLARLAALDADALQGKAVCVALHPGWVHTDMGGAGADLDVRVAVANMRRTLAALTPADNGRFLNHDGQSIDWQEAAPPLADDPIRE
jgi:NAD(P)-dependent dehydrogenase (short-subunit alcohol dehydrogenase family)